MMKVATTIRTSRQEDTTLENLKLPTLERIDYVMTHLMIDGSMKIVMGVDAINTR